MYSKVLLLFAPLVLGAAAAVPDCGQPIPVAPPPVVSIYGAGIPEPGVGSMPAPMATTACVTSMQVPGLSGSLQNPKADVIHGLPASDLAQMPFKAPGN